MKKSVHENVLLSIYSLTVMLAITKITNPCRPLVLNVKLFLAEKDLQTCLTYNLLFDKK